MGLWRPATKIRFWTPKVRHRSYVHPPGFLKLISTFAIFSIVGTILYYLADAIGGLASSTLMDTRGALYVAGLHFLLPFVIALAITTNSAMSRPLIVIYFLVLAGATALGEGGLGALPIDNTLRIALSALVFVCVSVYLYAGSKMRAYYALLRGDTVPKGTGEDAVELVENPWPGRRGRALLGWVADHLETIVIVGLIVTVIFALRSMTP